ncbi:hypothetical protein BN1110_06300 [bacterium YEK0313]|nr:hypothetical protein BN1110_06300 [bacterium YEK0313]
MLTVRLEPDEGVQIGSGPDAGAVIKVLARSGRKVALSIHTNLPVARHYFGLSPPAFRPGLAGASATSFRAVSCAAG